LESDGFFSSSSVFSRTCECSVRAYVVDLPLTVIEKVQPHGHFKKGTGRWLSSLFAHHPSPRQHRRALRRSFSSLNVGPRFNSRPSYEGVRIPLRVFSPPPTSSATNLIFPPSTPPYIDENTPFFPPPDLRAIRSLTSLPLSFSTLRAIAADQTCLVHYLPQARK